MLKKIIEQFAEKTELPIEVQEIADAIIGAGIQDEIHFVDVDADPAVIHGAFARFSYHKAIYGDPIWVTHIPYNSRDPLKLQRVVCSKEMIHLFDSDIERTDTPEEIYELIDKLLGPLTTDDLGLADLMAAKDKLAVYQCLPLLMPKAALQVARDAVAKGIKTPEEISEWAQIPVGLIHLMLQKEWDTINGRVA